MQVLGFSYMSSQMLIDASHPEETRVVVVNNKRVEEYDFESQHKKQLKGNIYLARVMRIEPSLQAAFVEYGNGRHGFLAFAEIHPDYYQIPVADRSALLEAEAAALAQGEEQETEAATENSEENGTQVTSVGGDDETHEMRAKIKKTPRPYKIQEVIKRRQILLVQIIKEERGNKGAALTTYLSLAGRYSVLMPNTPRGAGISRKISNTQERKKLKEIAKQLTIPQGMGVILRTAGAKRTKSEIKRDFDYLIRLWEGLRELTLESHAPCLIHEEGSLIKRSIRDLYHKEIDQILVAGDGGYREAKDFMRMLMPSHTKIVQPYKDEAPLLSKDSIEFQLDQLLQAHVSLKAGGYLVINQTEALVAIDVNSGKATREHSIEETALKTNLEAAEEVARQLRLRDLAGLVVIDFIDMNERQNIRTVEKKLKECLKNDRARIQVGQISSFGLLEMSRQRLRASVLESTMQVCEHCNGLGYIRSDSSRALYVLRAIEEHLMQHPAQDITVQTDIRTVLYILNHKRHSLDDLEKRFTLTIRLDAADNLGQQLLLINSHQPSIPQAKPKQDNHKPAVNAAAAGNADGASVAPQEALSKQQQRRRKRNQRINNKIPLPATAEKAQEAQEAPANIEPVFENTRKKKVVNSASLPSSPEAEGEGTSPKRPKRRNMLARNKKREKKSPAHTPTAIDQTKAQAIPQEEKDVSAKPALSVQEEKQEVSALENMQTFSKTSDKAKRRGWWQRRKISSIS